MPVTDSIFAGTITQSITSMVPKITAASAGWVSVVLNVTDVKGEDAEAVFRIQWSLDGGTWAEASPADAFDPIREPACVVKRFSTKAPYWRAVCDVTGTDPEFTGSANSYS